MILVYYCYFATIFLNVVGQKIFCPLPIELYENIYDPRILECENHYKVQRESNIEIIYNPIKFKPNTSEIDKEKRLDI